MENLLERAEALENFRHRFPELLRRYRRIKLVAEELIGNGKVMTLRPVQPVAGQANNYGRSFHERMFLNKQTFPRLDLRAAGIEWDRTETTIRDSAREFLKQRRFNARSVDAGFFELKAFELSGADLLALAAKLNGIAISANLPLRSTDLLLEEDTAEAYASLPQSSLVVEADGGSIPGLDLSKPVEGWRGEIRHLLIPPMTPEYQAFRMCMASYYPLAMVNRYQEELKQPGVFFLTAWRKKRKLHRVEQEAEGALREFDKNLALIAA